MRNRSNIYRCDNLMINGLTEEIRELYFKKYKRKSMAIYLSVEYTWENNIKVYRLINALNREVGKIYTDKDNIIIDIVMIEPFSISKKYIGIYLEIIDSNNLLLYKSIRASSQYSFILLFKNKITDLISDMIPNDTLFNSEVLFTFNTKLNSCRIRYNGEAIAHVYLRNKSILRSIVINDKFKDIIDINKLTKFYGHKLLIPWK